jgi:hypothetical protein
MAEKTIYPKGRNYRFTVKVGKKDISQWLDSCKVVNTMNSIYPIVSMIFKMDCDEVLTEDMFGQNLIDFSIISEKEDQQIVEVLDLKLLYLQSNLNLVTKSPMSQNVEQSREPIVMTTLIYPCYVAMSKKVNPFFEEPANTSPLDIVQQVYLEQGFEAEVDPENKNETPINQLLVPTMSTNKFINYMHDTYGLFKGPMFRYCSWDNVSKQPLLQLWDSSRKIKKEQIATIFHLSSYSDQGYVKSIVNKCSDGKHFYTSSPLRILNTTNASVARYNYEKTMILHPDDLLFHKIKKTADEMTKQYGVTDQVKSMMFYDGMKNNIDNYMIGLKGLGYDDSALTSKFSEQYQNTSCLKLTLVRNVQIEGLMKIGNPILLYPSTTEYLKFKGKYILQSSDITWSKGDSEQWNCNVDLELFRSTIEK